VGDSVVVDIVEVFTESNVESKDFRVSETSIDFIDCCFFLSVEVGVEVSVEVSVDARIFIEERENCELFFV
jgi:hypothetical protein